MRAIPEFSGITPDQFQNEIYPKALPAVLRGFVAHWPSVALAMQSTDHIVSYLKGLDCGRSVELLEASAQIKGRFFYSDDFTGTNFSRTPYSLGAGIDRIAAAGDAACNIQSSLIDDVMPQFASQNSVTFLSPSIRPRIWIGNKVTVQTHFDLSQNIACVVAGRRKFTLYPPEQVRNLYMGPIERSLAGTPVSLVQPDDVDYKKYPRFKLAEEAALSTELGPGDAIFIPYFWWHHVRSLGAFNVLVNYWWNEYDVYGSPMDAFLHLILTVKSLPPSMKAPWKEMLDEFVFGDSEEAVSHIPQQVRGGLGHPTPQDRSSLWHVLARNIVGFANRTRS